MSEAIVHATGEAILALTIWFSLCALVWVVGDLIKGAFNDIHKH